MTFGLETILILVGLFALASAGLVALLARQYGQREAAERAYTESDAVARCLYDQSPDCVLTINSHLLIQAANKNVEAEFGYPASELMGRLIGSLVPGLMGLGGVDPGRKIRRTRDGLELHDEVRRRDGVTIPMRIFVREASVRARRFFIVTLRREIAPALTAAEDSAERETFRKLLDFSGAAVIRLGPAGEILGMNEGAEALTGYAESEIRGKLLWETIADAGDETLKTQVEQVAANGEEQRSALPWRSRDGATRLVACLLRKSDDQLLLAGVEAAEPHSKTLGAARKLALGVVIEFADVLTVINGYGELLSDGADDAIRGDLERIRQAALRGSSVTSELVAFGGALPMDTKLVDLNDLIGEHHEHLRSLDPELSVSLELDNQPAPVWADPHLLVRGLSTLVSCIAAKRPATRGVTIRTARAALPDGGYLICTVTDQPSLPEPPAPARDFVPFSNGNGGALHLAAVYGLTRQNGGQMMKEQGANTYHLYFPLDPVAAGAIYCSEVS